MRHRPARRARSLAAALLVFALGASVGTVTTVGLLPTGYTESQLQAAADRADHEARSAVEQEALAAVRAADSRLEETESRLEAATTRLERLATSKGRLERRLDRRAQAVDRLQEEVRALTAKAAAARARTAEQADAPAGGESTVTGTLRTSWTLTSADAPWPRDCLAAQSSYQVRVNDGSGDPVAIGPMVASRMVERSKKDGVLTLSCILTYQADIPSPRRPRYEFVAVSSSKPGVALQSTLVKQQVLADGSGPELSVSLCQHC